MEEQIVPSDTPTDEVIVEPTTDEPKELGLPADPVEVEPKDDDEVDTEALKQRNQELYEQLKKAKGFVRDAKTGKWVKKEAPKPVEQEKTIPGDITRTELYSLVKANVPDEDTNEVIVWARSHNVSVTDALKTPEVKAILGVRQEYRKSAETANINATRRGASKISEEQILEKAMKGEFPSDPAELAKARMAQKLKDYASRKGS